MRLWVPVLRVEVLKLAEPVLFRLAVPRIALPSRKVTIPIGGWDDCDVFVTLAVRVRFCPLIDRLVLENNVVVVVAGGGWIVSVSAGLVEEAELAVA